MKRNMELIRLMLLQAEGDPTANEDMTKYSAEEFGYHAQLLIDAGLIEGHAVRNPSGCFVGAIVSRLTWSGHEFLETMRDDTLWIKAKENVLKPGASWSFEILKEWAKHELKQKLGLPE